MTAAPAVVPRWRAAPRGVRYVLVGGICAALNNIFLVAAVAAGFRPMAALWLVCPAMLVIGYALHVKVTFDAKPSPASFLRYSLAILANYPLWIASLYLLCDVARASIYLAGPIATLVVFVANYVATHWAIQRSLRAAFRFRGMGADSLATRPRP